MHKFIIFSLCVASASAAGGTAVNNGGDPAKTIPQSAGAASIDKSIADSSSKQRRAMRPMFLSTDPECKYCGDVQFVYNAQDAMDVCPNQLKQLEARLNAATSDSQISSAWASFCTGTCSASIARIDDDHTCCLGDYAALAENVKYACGRSSQGNYCGISITALQKGNCTAPSEATCTTKANCQWDAAASACYFNANSGALASMCDECNRNYFTRFFAGGIYDPNEHAALAAQYANFCTMFNGTSTYSLASFLGFRLADGLYQTDINTRVCANTEVGRRGKLALRTNSFHVSEGIRRKALHDWKRCWYGYEYLDVMCRDKLVHAFNQAAAIDATALSVCQRDSKGDVCLARFVTATQQNACVHASIEGNFCDDGCSAASATVINGLGCCAHTVGFNGFIAAKTNMSSIALSQWGRGLDFVNRSRDSTTGPRASITDNDLAIRMVNAKNFALGTDGLATLRQCGGVSDGDFSAQCGRQSLEGKKIRSYEINLALSYNAVAAAAFPHYLKTALTADLAVAIGVGRFQVRSLTFAPSPTEVVRIDGVDHAALNVTLSIEGDSDADNQASDDILASHNRGKSLMFPAFGAEVAYMAPKAFRNRHTALFRSAFAVPSAADSPLSRKAEADLVLRYATPPTTAAAAKPNPDIEFRSQCPLPLNLLSSVVAVVMVIIYFI